MKNEKGVNEKQKRRKGATKKEKKGNKNSLWLLSQQP